MALTDMESFVFVMDECGCQMYQSGEGTFVEDQFLSTFSVFRRHICIFDHC